MYSYEDRLRAVQLYICQVGKTSPLDDSPARLSDQECAQELVSGAWAA